MTDNTPVHDDASANSRDRRTSSGWAVGAPVLFSGPLQTVSVEQGQTSVLGIALVVALLGVGGLLTYQAFRGYRHSDDRSMALFAVGLFLLTVVHAGLKLVSEFVVPVLLDGEQELVLAIAATSQLVDVAGLVLVFYAILR